MQMPKIFSAIAAAVLLISANVSAESKAIAFDEGVNWTAKSITVKGEGFAPEDAVNRDHAAGLALTAAKADAYRKLGEIINGVHVEGDKTVAGLIETQTVRVRVEATINGAKIVGQDLLDERNGNCAVYMQVPMFGENSLAGAVLEKSPTVEPFPNPEFESSTPYTAPLTRVPGSLFDLKSLNNSPPLTQKTEKTSTKKSVKDYADTAQGDYTGLIVDCRGLGLKPVMSPVILNTNGTKIYGHKNLDYDKVTSQGMADYVSDPTQVSRAGDKPLVVKAVKLENFNSNPVLSIKDSNRVLIENHATKFLNDLKVVFITD